MTVMLTWISGSLLVLSPNVAKGMDFLEKRTCTLDFGNNRAPIHTRCVISGGMQGGTIDVSIRTPDGRTYALEGPIDGEKGHKFLLQQHPAFRRHNEMVDDNNCYARKDGRLTMCFGDIAE
jgi:hypothetical protein